MKPFMWIAFDELAKREKETLKIADKLANCGENGFGFKSNIDWVLLKGLEAAVKTLQQFERPIFIDLKLFNGSRTIANIIERLVDLGVNLTNVHALLADQLTFVLNRTYGTNTQVIGLTVLSHHGEDWAKNFMGVSRKEAARILAKTALDSGCHGIIVPGALLPAVSDLECHVKLATGIRPLWYGDLRHVDPVVPGRLKDLGATDGVIGGPVMEADDPVEALKATLQEL